MSIDREHNGDKINQALEPHKDLVFSFDANNWLEDPNNIALTDGEGNYTLYTYDAPGVYSPHVFFKVRGKEAIDLALDMLETLFENYDVRVLRGLTPVEKLPARWFAHKIGFKSLGEVETVFGWCELTMMTRDNFYDHLEATGL